MAIGARAGLLGDGGSVVASPVACSYVFTWAGTASNATPATLASYATAWAASTEYDVGDVVLTTDGYAIGCVVEGTTASSGTGPTLATFSVAPIARKALACGASVAVVVDGTAQWMLLSGPANVINVAVYNRHATAVLDVATAAAVAAGTGVPVPPNYAAQNFDGAAPETLYVISSVNGSAFSVVVYA